MPEAIKQEPDKKAEEVKKPATETTKTPEEIQASTDEMMQAMGFLPKKQAEDEPPKKEEEKTEEPAAKVEEKKEEDDKEETPPVAKKKKKALAASKEEPAVVDDKEATLERIAQRASEKTVKAMEDAKAGKEEPNKPAGELELSEEDKETVSALEYLEKKNPKYAGVVKKTHEFWKKEQEFMEKWETEHPGENFNPEDHPGFYKRYDPGVPDEDLVIAKRAVERQRLTDEVKRDVAKEMSPELERIKAKEAYETAAPKIAASASLAVSNLVAAIPEFTKLATDAEGNLLPMTQEIITQMEELSPLAVNIVDEEAALLKTRVTELEKLTHLGEHYKADEKMRVKVGDNVIRPHADILDAAQELEEKIMALPKAQQLNDGKQFLPAAQMNGERQRIIQSNASAARKSQELANLYNNFWTIGTDDIAAKLQDDSARAVQKKLATFKVTFNKPGDHAAKNGAKNDDKKVEEPTKKTTVPKTPVVTASSDNVDTHGIAKNKSLKSDEEFLKAFF